MTEQSYGESLKFFSDWQKDPAKRTGLNVQHTLTRGEYPTVSIEIGVSLDIENYCTLRLFFDLSTLAGLNRRNLPEAGILLLFQI